ncbi:hypothetical protein APY04_0581 [Hyphomicrobium sulfonivorans]|uniref:Uncharacterized protein n=1 Tax=Hyphomicrobium sulfonivorans TaxID=121290 RepID=A0A125NVU0_HYPSL|nr:hypothetical protein APY04_0581 [Hyphomicrobium sulfonivorans]
MMQRGACHAAYNVRAITILAIVAMLCRDIVAGFPGIFRRCRHLTTMRRCNQA